MLNNKGENDDKQKKWLIFFRGFLSMTKYGLMQLPELKFPKIPKPTNLCDKKRQQNVSCLKWSRLIVIQTDV